MTVHTGNAKLGQGYGVWSQPYTQSRVECRQEQGEQEFGFAIIPFGSISHQYISTFFSKANLYTLELNRFE